MANWESEPQAGQPFWWRTGAGFADFNNDGLMDMITLDGFSRELQLFCQYQDDAGRLRFPARVHGRDHRPRRGQELELDPAAPFVRPRTPPYGRPVAGGRITSSSPVFGWHSHCSRTRTSRAGSPLDVPRASRKRGRGGQTAGRFALRVSSWRVCVGMIVLLLVAGLVLSRVALEQSPPPEPVTFRNPLNQSHGSDPWMVYYEGRYYLAATTWSPSSRPGLTMKSAPTIQGLKDASPVSIYTDTDMSRCCNFWAPEFFLLDGPNGLRWYFYYSGGPWKCCDGQRMHVLESAGTDPMGPYTYKARLHDSIDGWAIDHSILQLDGSLYLLFSAWLGSNQNIYIAPMSDPWTINGKRVLLSTPTCDWEIQDGRDNYWKPRIEN